MSGIAGSNPVIRTKHPPRRFDGEARETPNIVSTVAGVLFSRSPVVQPEEHFPAKEEAVGSSPTGRARQGAKMPTYDYTCPSCSKKQEVVKGMKEYGEPVHCPKCGERMIRFWGKRAPAARFVGNGFTGARKNG